MNQANEIEGREGIAIIGMAGRFPGASTIEEFWQNLCQGVESITILEEGDQAIVRDPALRDHAQYVPAGAFLDGIDLFDASFFGYNAREAQIMDPQHRVFLECAWEALERAGYDPHRCKERIGVYAGSGMNRYLLEHVYPNRELMALVGGYQLMLSSDKDFLATRVAYHLGLKGPALTVQTACSTSLVAVALAFQSLQCYQCDLALAGGVSFATLQREGYLYEQGGIASPDGHCRAFDADARGTVGGSGLGIVVLKRLDEALADHDQIYAVIKAVAVNNDGDSKIGYTAPGIEGQIEVITEALALANVEPETIQYIEAHGTGTFVGDPIEVSALTRAFQAQTTKTAFCAMGSVKTNIGHLDTAAGVAGLIKASLAIKHKMIPPSLNFTRPNPQIDFENSPFYINTTLSPWPNEQMPRRAGVSSFGIGGTNAHAIIEECPMPAEEECESIAPELLVLSARTPSALEVAMTNLAAHLEAHPELKLADVAYTLQVGRRSFQSRCVTVCQTREEAIAALRSRDPQKVFAASLQPGDKPCVFLFPGQGAQHIAMGRQLYQEESVYRQWVDFCSEQLAPLIKLDLRLLLFPDAARAEEAAERLNQTDIAQPALFVTEYALARLLETYGIKPQAMLGHSLGEYVAACLAGVMSLEDALLLVAERGRFMQELPEGAMLSVALSAGQVRDLLTDELAVSVDYGANMCVIGGPKAAIATLAGHLQEKGVDARPLQTSHAFHSAMMEPILEPFCQVVRGIRLHPPQIPYVSGLTGTWITSEEAVSPEYWTAHIRQTVQLAAGLQTLLSKSGAVLLEVGPAQTLKALLRSQKSSPTPVFISSMRHPLASQSDREALLLAIGKLWLAGIQIDLSELSSQRRRFRVLLPTYPFERRRYWVEAHNHAIPQREPDRAINEHSFPSTGDNGEKLASQRERTSAKPRTATEQKVLAIWRELLGSEEIGVDDNFFELGGHSLLAIRLIARLRETFQVELPERALYEQQTIASLSRAIEQSQQALQKIVSTSRQQPLLASWQQERRWRLDQLRPSEREKNNLSVGWELLGPLDFNLFEQSVNEVIRRHEILRTMFAEVDGKIVQVIAPPFAVSIPLIDLTSLPEEEREAEMLRRAAEQDRTAFDMCALPLWSMALFRIGDNRHVWSMVFHQSVWDGVSTALVQKEIAIIFNGLLSRKPWTLPEASLQYVDVARWERLQFQGELLESTMSYWKQKLAGDLCPLELPVDRPRTNQYAQSAQKEWSVPKSIAERLRALSQEQKTTLFVTMVAAIKVLCYGYTGQENILVETTFTNRDRSELLSFLGPLANAVTLRTSLAGNPGFREIVARVRETVLQAIAHRSFPFSRVLAELQPDFYTRHESPGRISMVQYSTDEDLYPFSSLTYGRRFYFRRAFNDIYIPIADLGEKIIGLWEYDTHLFDEATITRMTNACTLLLERIAADPNQRLSELVKGLC